VYLKHRGLSWYMGAYTIIMYVLYIYTSGMLVCFWWPGFFMWVHFCLLNLDVGLIVWSCWFICYWHCLLTIIGYMCFLYVSMFYLCLCCCCFCLVFDSWCMVYVWPAIVSWSCVIVCHDSKALCSDHIV